MLDSNTFIYCPFFVPVEGGGGGKRAIAITRLQDIVRAEFRVIVIDM